MFAACLLVQGGHENAKSHLEIMKDSVRSAQMFVARLSMCNYRDEDCNGHAQSFYEVERGFVGLGHRAEAEVEKE